MDALDQVVLRGPAQLSVELKSDRVAAYIRGMILTGQLATGQRLPTESELCDLLGVSRSVIRDAVRTLSAHGLVTVEQGRGMTVAGPSDDGISHALALSLARSNVTMGQVMDARAVLELELIPWAARNRTEHDLSVLNNALDSFQRAVGTEDWPQALELHLEFHSAIISAIHLPALELLLRPVQEVFLVSAMPPKDDLNEGWEVESHYPILEALQAGDELAAEVAMRDHSFQTLSDDYKSFRADPFAASIERLSSLFD